MTNPTPGPPPPDPNDWLMGGGTKSASFNGPPPITWAGEVLTPPTLVQKRDFDTGEPLFWNDGRPKQMLQVNIGTDQRDPSDPDDDGSRALYLEFRKAQAVRDAVKRAGTNKVEQGGWLSLTYTSDDHAARKGKGNPPKNFAAEYRPPDPLAQAGAQADPWDTRGWPTQQHQQPAAQPPTGGWAQQPQLPPQTPQAAPQQPAENPLHVFLRSKGVDPSQMDANQASLVAQTLGYQG